MLLSSVGGFASTDHIDVVYKGESQGYWRELYVRDKRKIRNKEEREWRQPNQLWSEIREGKGESKDQAKL